MNPTRLIVGTALVLLLGCSGRDAEIGNGTRAVASGKSETPAPLALLMLHMADPAAAPQLASGFHAVEQSAWRWTERKFSVMLKPPQNPTPAQLKFRFAISPVVVERLKSVTLKASTDGAPVGSETYTAPGEYLFSKPLPVQASGDKPIAINFELDRAIAAGDLETRELGVIAISVGLE
jgi:hypothetical protein